jgi:hypothetical protein
MDSRRVDRVRYIADPVPASAESEDER